jgi:hypothetical protein
MPEKMDETPSGSIQEDEDEQDETGRDADEIVYAFLENAVHAHKVKKATIHEYDAMMLDRPVKFNPEQVGYGESDGEMKCGGCLHYYTGVTAKRSVCEIMRPPGDDVDADNVCEFWTKDGVNFPKLPAEAKANKKSQPQQAQQEKS